MSAQFFPTAEQVTRSKFGQLIFNVVELGADPTGVRDSTAQLQQALNYAGSSMGGATVWVPYTPNGFVCGALVIPPGVRLQFDRGAKLVAPASLSTSWLLFQQGAVHQGTSVIGGTWDASAVTSTSCYAVIDTSGVTSVPNVRISGNRIINAPVHGIFIGEATFTYDKKWVDHNSIEGYGMRAVGYGIFASYVGSIEIDSNFVGGGTNDGIELGHSGYAYLSIHAHMRCTNNTIVSNGTLASGQLQFPFSDNAEIIGNTVIGNTIQNDANTADHVVIVANKVINATPQAGYAGIWVHGDYAEIADNDVQVTTLDGIGSDTMVHHNIVGNIIASSAATSSGTAINDTGSGSQRSLIADNQAYTLSGGGFVTGIAIAGLGHQITGNHLQSYVALNVTGTYNNFANNSFLQGGGGIGSTGDGTNTYHNNPGYNPVGPVTVAVPASGSATAALPYDATFYITQTTAASSVAVQGQAIAIPVGGPTAIRVPAGETLTPTYTTAPTWVVMGE